MDKLQLPRLHFTHPVPPSHQTRVRWCTSEHGITAIKMYCQTLFSVTLLLVGAANAQFQFFENMFGGHQGGHQQQQQGNAPSDSNWYQQHWDQGMSVPKPLSPMDTHYGLVECTWTLRWC